MHYPGAFNRATRARQLAVSDDSSVLFYPSGSVVQVRADGLRCTQLGTDGRSCSACGCRSLTQLSLNA